MRTHALPPNGPLWIVPLVAAFVLVPVANAQPDAERVDGTVDEGAVDEGGAADGDATAASAERVDPRVLLRGMADYFCRLPAAKCRITLHYRVEAQGFKQEMASTMSLCRELPNRLAFRLVEGQLGMTTVCDGKQVLRVMPMLNRYTLHEAPDKLSNLLSEEFSSAAGFAIFEQVFCADEGQDLFELLVDGVLDAQYLGTDRIGEVSCHHCRFLQREIDWDVWIESGATPVIRRLQLDLGKQMEAAAETLGEELQGAKMAWSLELDQWDVAAKFSDADFDVTPPADAEKVDSLLAGFDTADEEPHPLIGQPAPIFSTVDLNETPVSLDAFLGEKVILLDFWATWCGPCVSELPKIAAVAEKYANRGVVFLAVNVGEDAETVRDFLDSEELQIPIALDPEGKISDQYHAEAIPLTMLIGKDRKVQVAHVGASGDVEKQLAQQIDELLAGKDLAAQTLAKANSQASNDSTSPTARGARSLWSLQGNWYAVAAQPASSAIVAVGMDGSAVRLSTDGKVKDRLKLSPMAANLRLAKLSADQPNDLICFGAWGHVVSAYGPEGNLLWEYRQDDAIDDVWAADLDGDHRDEVIVGYNGGGGLHLLDRHGAQLAKTTQIGNVWHVCAGDVDGDGVAEVVTTSARGHLHVFNGKAESMASHHLSVYASIVRTLPARPPSAAQRCLVGGSSPDGEKLLAIDDQGNEIWAAVLSQSRSASIHDLAIATGSPWAAAGLRGGLIVIIDVENGTAIAHIETRSGRPSVAWLDRPEQSPLLLVATGAAVQAFEIENSNANGH
jgi:peroxiredoxin